MNAQEQMRVYGLEHDTDGLQVPVPVFIADELVIHKEGTDVIPILFDYKVSL